MGKQERGARDRRMRVSVWCQAAGGERWWWWSAGSATAVQACLSCENKLSSAGRPVGCPRFSSQQRLQILTGMPAVKFGYYNHTAVQTLWQSAWLSQQPPPMPRCKC